MDRTEESQVHHWLTVLRRRWFIALLCTLAVPAVAVALSAGQTHQYQGEADVLLTRANLAASLTGGADSGASGVDADRLAETQALIAHTNRVAKRVTDAVRSARMTPERFLGVSAVTQKGKTDVLAFTVTGTDPPIVAQLANEYARQYTVYRAELDTAALRSARSEVDSRLNDLAASGRRDTKLYRDLQETEQQISMRLTLQTRNASIVRAAEPRTAVQIAPKPFRNGVIGLV